MSHNVKVLGIHGPSGSGKDEFADTLVAFFQDNDIDVIRYSFADPIKDICKYIFGGTRDTYYTQEGKRTELDSAYGLTVRQLLQKVGTECFRNIIDDNVWIDVFLNNVYSPLVNTADGRDRPTIILVPDVREAREIRALQNIGGIILGIIPDFPEYVKLETTHSSEVMHYDLSDINYRNDGTKEEFKEDALSTAKILLTTFIGQQEKTTHEQ